MYNDRPRFQEVGVSPIIIGVKETPPTHTHTQKSAMCWNPLFVHHLKNTEVRPGLNNGLDKIGIREIWANWRWWDLLNLSHKPKENEKVGQRVGGLAFDGNHMRWLGGLWGVTEFSQNCNFSKPNYQKPNYYLSMASLVITLHTAVNVDILQVWLQIAFHLFYI